jgi:mitochondrial chaperone BCS1
VDLKEYIGYVSEHQLAKLFKRFYPSEGHAKAELFAKATLAQGFSVSAAQVQGLFLMFKNNPDELFRNLSFLAPQSPLRGQSVHQAPFHDGHVQS